MAKDMKNYNQPEELYSPDYDLCKDINYLAYKEYLMSHPDRSDIAGKYLLFTDGELKDSDADIAALMERIEADPILRKTDRFISQVPLEGMVGCHDIHNPKIRHQKLKRRRLTGE